MNIDTTLEACNARRVEQQNRAKAKKDSFLRLRAETEVYPYSQLLTEFHVHYIAMNKIAFIHEPKELNSYDDLLAEFEETGVIRVSSLHSGNTIYRTELENVLFRVVHDFMHCVYELPFSDENDITLGFNHLREFMRWCELSGVSDGVSFPAWKLLYIDIIGQAEYLKTNGVFVDNQIQFALDQLGEE